MTALSETTPTPAASAPAKTATTRRVPRAGWMVIGSKEFGDHLLSSRFVVLVVIIGLAAAVPLYFLSGTIRGAAEAAKEVVPALYIGLFWLPPSVNSDITLPSVVGFLAIVGPLLGLAFSFDAINGERADGTLPRLLSQPVHRDDVINGKFAAGLAVISFVLVLMVGAVTAFALIRMGIVPDPNEVLRVIGWVAVTIVYIAFWSAFGLLLSVVIRRAATSALVGFGVWLLATFFGGLIVSLVSGLFQTGGATLQDQLSDVGVQQTLSRFLPDTLYREASITLLNPQVTSVSAPATVANWEQAQQQMTSVTSLNQPLILVWPQVVGLVGLTVACFALAYVLFMRQEVRA